jgi:hypothetical protein
VIRVVVTVLLAVALLGVAQPAVDAARAERTATTLTTDVERIERAATSLLDRDDPPPSGVRGARRSLAMRLPKRGVAAAGVEYVVVGGRPRPPSSGSAPSNPGAPPPRTADTVTYKLAGRPPAVVRLDGIDLRTANGPIRLGTPGRHRLRLTLVATDGDPAVLVERSESGIRSQNGEAGADGTGAATG